MASAEERAMSALSKVNNIGFSTFTASLIGDTVDAVVGSTVKQLKSYAELVKELEAGLESFKAKAVTDESVAQYMREAYPGPGAETAVAVGKTYDRDLYQQIIARCGAIDGLSEPQADEMLMFDDQAVQQIESKSREILNRTAEGSFEQLRVLVQMGYARVVFTSGRIKTKLTFDVQSTDQRQRSSSDLAQSSFRAGFGMGGGIMGWLTGISGSVSSQSLQVRTVSERSMETDRVVGDILGEVEVNFATQTFPSLDIKPQAARQEQPR